MTRPVAKAVAKKVPTKKPVSRTHSKPVAPKPESKPEISEPKAKPSKLTQGSKNVVRKQARYYAPIQKPVKSVVTYRHMLAAEYVFGILIIMTQKQDFKQGDKETIGVLLQASSFTLVWVILFFITSGGRNAARISSGLGGIIILTLALKQGNIFDRFAGVYGGKKNAPALPPSNPADAANLQNTITGDTGQTPNPSTDLGGIVGLGPSGFGS